MIDLSTPNDILLKELYEENPKADYWHVKKGGGELKVAKQVAEYKRRRLLTGQDFIGRCTEYVSSKGNRWIIFDKVSNRPVEGITALSMKFVYYETIGSVGCFIPAWYVKRPGAPIEFGVTIFTSHFFMRYCDRLKIPFCSTQMIQEFMDATSGLTMQPDKDKDGRDVFVFRVPKAGFAYAVSRNGDNRILEVRTFLSDKNMSPSKLKKYKDLTKWVESAEHRKLSLVEELIAAKIAANGYKPPTVQPYCD